jgi:hypothetical protein
MLIDDLIVEVRDANLDRVGQLLGPDLNNLLVVPRANSIGSWSIDLPDSVIAPDGTVSQHALGALLRTPGYGIIVSDPTGVRLSGPLTAASHNADTTDPGGTWTLSGVSDAVVLARSECWPDPTNSDAATAAYANDVRTGNAETLMRDFFRYNIGPDASVARMDARLTLATNLGRGPTLTKSPRYQNMLELFQLICAGTDLLFDVRQDGTDLQLQISEAVDRTATVRMDIDNNQLESSHVEYSAPGVTHVLVLGQGEGTERQAIQRTSAESLAAAAQWGMRAERTIDQRNTDDVDELEQAGDDLLSEEGKTVTSMRVVPSGDQAETFGVGDWVTVVVGTQELPAQVTELPISVTPNGVFVGCTVGDPQGFDWESLVNARQTKVESRVSNLERNAEPPALDLFARANRLRNPDFRVNQRGYVSGASLAPQQYGPDGWCASGLINHFLNPRAVGAGNIENNSSTTVAAISTDSFTGWTSGRSFKITFNSTSPSNARMVLAQAPAAVAGERWSASALFYNGSAGTREFSTYIRFIDAAGSLISTVSDFATLAAGAIMRSEVSGIAPTGTAKALILFTRNSGTGATAGDIAYIDEVMLYRGPAGAPFFDGSSAGSMWTGAADASASYNIAAVGTITLPADPQGGLATLSSGMRVFQPIERENIPAGSWLFDQPGSAEGRVFNASDDPDTYPAFQSFPIVFVADGSDDVIVEARATGGTATLGNVQLIPGAVARPYVPRLLSEERPLCEWFHRRLTAESPSASMPFGTGVMTSTTNLTVQVLPGHRMRTVPVVTGTAAASLQVRTAANLTVSAYVISAGSSPDAIVLDVTTSAGTAGQSGLFRGTAVGHYLDLDAELQVYAA